MRGVTLGGRTVLLTGASGGLGHALARALARRGARLVLTARRAEVLAPLAEEVGGRALPCDLSDRAALEQLVADAGPVDVLVSNAGIPGSGTIGTFTPEQIDRTLDVNLRAPILLTRLLSDGMEARGGGHIVFVNSLNGKAGAVRTSVYAASKFGLRGFAQSVREDLRPRGIGVSSIFPGFIRDAGMYHDSGARVPVYVGTKEPDDVARAVIRAIERDRAEIDVAPLPFRAGVLLASVLPGPVAAVQRRLGADKIARQFEAGQQAKR